MALTAEHVPATQAKAPASAGRLSRSLTPGRFYLALAGTALVLAALSLLIPSTPSYDPWSWLIWGREIIHLDLHTSGGPSWKPLPMIFTTVFALFGHAAPDLWLVVARAGAIVAVAVAGKLAWRTTRMLTGERTWAPEILAAVIAGGSLAVGSGFVSDNALGYSEGLMTALVLIAVDRHLDGDRRTAFALGLGAALDRPEIWAFWGLYGLWLFWRDAGARKLVVILFALIPVLWFLPELWGSGQLFRGVSRAQAVRSNSAAKASFPFWTELSGHAWKHVLLRIKVPAAAAILVALGLVWRARASLDLASPRSLLRRPAGPLERADRARLDAATTDPSAANGHAAAGGTGADAERASQLWPHDRLHGALALILSGLLGAAWWVLISVMTQAGFSGNDRYLILGAALISVAGGVAWGWAGHGLGVAAGRLLADRAPGRGGPPALARLTGAGTLACVAVFMVLPPWIGANVVDIPATHRALVYQAKLRSGITTAVRRAGGPAAILRCGSVMTEGFQVPLLAWTLHVHTVQVVANPLAHQPVGKPPATIFQTRAQRKATLLPSFPQIRAWTAAGARYHVVTRTSTFRVLSTCPL